MIDIFKIIKNIKQSNSDSNMHNKMTCDIDLKSDKMDNFIEFSLNHFPYPLANFHGDTLDYFLSEEQLDDLYDDKTDFKNYSDFKKWIPIIFSLNDLNPHDFTDKSHPYTIACKNCLKYLIASNSFIDHDIYISGIDGMYNVKDDYLFWNEYHIFLIRVYQYLFKEQFVYEDISKFRERIDVEFVENPGQPELWKEPIYKE